MSQSFRNDNSEFEAWLRTQCDVVEADLEYKHERMKKSSFVFLRATYFRWAKCIEELCPELARAPAVLSIGDSHVENFGTWRDAEARPVWGVNDFDEAADIAYPFDLVRLATSVRLSPWRVISDSDVADAILDGYRTGLKAPRPILLDEQETWMRPYVTCTDEDRTKFWKEIDGYPDANPPTQVADDLAGNIPECATVLRFATRVKGGGSLGRARYVVIASWRGGRIVREAKALVPSAWTWAHDNASGPTRFLELANGRYRSPDPFLAVRNGYVVRRVAADSRKVDLGDNASAELTVQLLRAMGSDLGSIHAAGDSSADLILEDLDKRSNELWLSTTATTVAAAVERDYTEWTGQQPQ